MKTCFKQTQYTQTSMLLFTAGLFDWSMQHQSSQGPTPKQVTPEEQKWWVMPVFKFVSCTAVPAACHVSIIQGNKAGS
jgi:hypothetical protein